MGWHEEGDDKRAGLDKRRWVFLMKEEKKKRMGCVCAYRGNARRLEIQCLISKIDSARLIRPYPQWYRFNRVRVKNVIILVRRIDFCIDYNGERRKEV